MGLEYLIGISYVEDTDVFKSAWTIWNILVLELFEAHRNMENPAIAGVMSLQMLSGMVDGLGSQILQRRHLYAGPMSKLRVSMISRMDKL
ncbi:hypothetical protein Syun_006537 [Stephania yunnanensis]|uniref:Uncharacterized protein n=1 Tax=Stephania yunnanensis TaxID=152371 RepID=A0AAP0Q1F9_9MAGN